MKKTNILAVLILAVVGLINIVPADTMPNNSQMMEMMQRIYLNDMATETGRVKWHGHSVAQVIDTNALIKVTRYADGYTVTNKWQLVRPIDSVNRQTKKLQAATNGIPAKLADARIKRIQNIETPVKEVTVITNVNRSK